MWFRRDLRLGDNPALLEACADGAVLPLFVLDPALWGPAGPSRRAYLGASLRALDGQLRQRGTRLSVVRGGPVRRVVLAAKAVGAERVHVAADYGPYGHQRDQEVEQALADAGIELVRTGSPYAVAPGRVTNGSGDPYKVFTPFSRAWSEHGWRDPVDPPTGVSWLELDRRAPPTSRTRRCPTGSRCPRPARPPRTRRWAEFLDRVDRYDEDRDKPGVDGTSHMSVHLKYGEIHPRTMLAALSRKRSAGAATYRKELAWREFYADVLFQQPRTAAGVPASGVRADAVRRAGRAAGRLAARPHRLPDRGRRACASSARTGWMHNRVRMIVASFLVKDLHLEWQHGARHFMHWLVDGDLASNQHGWQWTAGSGTDAAPYFRVFNPTSQGRKFDPQGGYVRRWVEELARRRPGARPARPGRGHPRPGRLPRADRRPQGGAAGGPRPVGGDPLTLVGFINGLA